MTGASRGYKSITEMLTGKNKKSKVKKKAAPKSRGKKPSYKIPKTPKTSGRRWGG